MMKLLRDRLVGTDAVESSAAPTSLRPLASLGLELPSAEHIADRDRFAVPASYDLREAHPGCASVSAVRNQGACGGCWAFAGAEA